MSSHLWDRELDEGESKPPRGIAPCKVARGSRTVANLFSLALGVYFGAWVGLFVFASRTFGIHASSVLSLIALAPLVVGVRLRYRWPLVRPRELVFLLVLVVVASAGTPLVVWRWYESCLDLQHAEAVKWAEFQSRVRRDPAFRDVVIHRPHPPFKGGYWLSGTVASKADRDRLRMLAIQCGVELPYETPDASVVRDVKVQGDSPRPGSERRD
jgi:hypothetical protein